MSRLKAPANGYYQGMHASKRLLIVLAIVLAFAAGFSLADLLARPGSTAGAAGQTALYGQVLRDLQHDYYQPVDVGRLGGKLGVFLLQLQHRVLLDLLLDAFLQRQDGQLQNLHRLDHPRRQHLLLHQAKVLPER